ncbi:MAG TPA: LPS export ABC transporter permease LptG [Halothiobacillus sp.]|nr:LPS export ABC transporter permease LptG [Halothiobacillus sp.]
MGTLDRYIMRTVILGGLASAAAFALLIVIFGAIDELPKVSSQYSLWQAISFVLLTMPGYLYDFYPAAVLVGGLLGLGNLAAHSELTVMRCSGMSVLRLARPVLMAGVILAVLGMTMGETIGAWGQEQANQMRAEARGSGVSVNLKSGLWLRDGQRFINVGQALVGGRLNAVRMFEMNKQGLPYRELTAAYALTEGGDLWQLFDVHESTIVSGPDGPHVVVQHEARRDHVQLFSQKILNIAVLNPRHMNILQLNAYVHYLAKNQLDDAAYSGALWARVFAPISVLVMLLVTLPFVFANQRSGGAGRWLFIAIVLGVGYLTLVQIVSAFAPVYGNGNAFVPFLSAALPPILFGLLGFIRLRRLNPAARRVAR